MDTENIYFHEDTFDKFDCHDGTQRYAGGLRLTPPLWKQIQTDTISWGVVTNSDQMDETNLLEGHLVSVKLTEVNTNNNLYIVSDVTSDPDDEKTHYQCCLKNSTCDIETIVVSCTQYGTRADYLDDKTSRFVSGDIIKISFVPDFIIADKFDSDQLRSNLLSQVI